ncbi:MAG: hypothetical protein ABIP50_02420 [Candidatus Saccharimonadales bacterium]
MAKVLVDKVVVTRPWMEWLKIVLIGAGIGIVFWLLTIMLTRYVVEPLTCKNIADAANCVNASSLAGNIATVITALVAILILIRMRVIQPVILAVGTAALLWDLSAWFSGLFWLEAFGWTILLYGLCFGLFAWISRYSRLLFAVIISLMIILIIRIALVL